MLSEHTLKNESLLHLPDGSQVREMDGIVFY